MISAKEISKLLGKKFPPTDEQALVIEAGLEPMLVVAGAGSGKTETMSNRVVHLVANGLVRADQVLGLTFTRKAAGELAERIRNQLMNLQGNRELDLLEAEAEVSTYNSFAANLVKDYGLVAGIDPDAKLLGMAAAVQAMTDLFSRYDGDVLPGYTVSRAVSNSLALAASLSDHLVDDEVLEKETVRIIGLMQDSAPAPRFKKPGRPTQNAIEVMEERLWLMRFVNMYRDFKRQNSFMDYSDQVAFAAKIALEHPEVGQELRERYKVVLLDEFQDTSVAQLKFLGALFKNHAVTAVGDPNQAIYGWRGASQASLSLSQRYFSDEEVPTYNLSKAWRNDNNILAFANRVADPLRQAPNWRSESDRQKKQRERTASPILAPRDNAGVGQVFYTLAKTKEQEWDRIGQFLADHWKGHYTCAILCRNRSEFLPAAAELEKRGLAFEVHGSGGLLDDPAVKTLRAALSIVANPANGQELMPLLMSLNLGPRDLKLLWAYAGELARNGKEYDPEAPRPTALLSEAIFNPPPVGYVSESNLEQGEREKFGFSPAAHRRLVWLGNVLQKIQENRYLPLPELLSEAIYLLDLDVEVAASPVASISREALDLFVNASRDFAAQSLNPTLRGFLAWVEATETFERGIEAPASDPIPGAIQIMTVHAAKGLEWDWVIIPNLVDKKFPSDRIKVWTKQPYELPPVLRGDCQSLPELPLEVFADYKEINDGVQGIDADYKLHLLHGERCLFYVAATRAKQLLITSGAWLSPTGSVRRPSVFLEEAIEDEGATGLEVPLGENAVEEAPEASDTDEETNFKEWPKAEIHPLITRMKEAAVGVVNALETEENPVEITDPDLAVFWEEAKLLLQMRRQEEEHKPEIEVPASLATTKLSKLDSDPEAFMIELLRPIPAEPTEAASLGTIFHAWVEQELRLAVKNADETEFELPANLTAGQLKRLHTWQNNWKAMEILKTYEPIELEGDRAIVVSGIRIPARVDAVMRERGSGKVVIMDWKTGKVPQTPEERHIAARQLQIYKLVWSQAEGLNPTEVEARLCYVGHNQVVDLRELSDREFTMADLAAIVDKLG